MRPPRLAVPEFADQAWWPSWARDAMTGYLHEIIARTKPYSLIVPQLSSLLRETGVSRIVDLCSGAGGPWPRLRDELRMAGISVDVICTDLEPNSRAAHRLRAASGIMYLNEPVSATDVPSELRGARTMFSALHHFRDEETRAILAHAQAAGVPFAAFEATSRSWRGLFATVVIPISVLALMPLVRPRDWRALWLTDLPPLMPLAIWWDGLASTLRTARVDEIKAIMATLPQGHYEWHVEEIGSGPLPVLAVLGRPVPHESTQRGRREWPGPGPN